METIKDKIIQEFINQNENALNKNNLKDKIDNIILKSKLKNEALDNEFNLNNIVFIDRTLKYGIDKFYNLIVFVQEGIIFKDYFYLKINLFSSINLYNFLVKNSLNNNKDLKILIAKYEYEKNNIKSLNRKNKEAEINQNFINETKYIKISDHEICHHIYRKFIEFCRLPNNIADKYEGESDYLQKKYKYKLMHLKDVNIADETSIIIDEENGYYEKKQGEKISRYILENFNIKVLRKLGYLQYQIWKTDTLTINTIIILLKKEKLEEQNLIEKKKKIIKPYIANLINSIDSDMNGKVDVLEHEMFLDFIKNNQEIIQEINSDYIKNFVKINNYIKTKSENIQFIFDYIKNCIDKDDFDINFGILNNEINVYNQLQFHSLAMVTSLLEKDMILFYEIYETFDKIGIFNSNWENEVSNKLSVVNESISNLGDRLTLEFDSLRVSINEVGSQINNSLKKLTYANKASIENLTARMDYRLSSINSSINTNNLLTLINTYQVYKINQNTKSLKITK